MVSSGLWHRARQRKLKRANPLRVDSEASFGYCKRDEEVLRWLCLLLSCNAIPAFRNPPTGGMTHEDQSLTEAGTIRVLRTHSQQSNVSAHSPVEYNSSSVSALVDDHACPTDPSSFTYCTDELQASRSIKSGSNSVVLLPIVLLTNYAIPSLGQSFNVRRPSLPPSLFLSPSMEFAMEHSSQLQAYLDTYLSHRLAPQAEGDYIQYFEDPQHVRECEVLERRTTLICAVRGASVILEERNDGRRAIHPFIAASEVLHKQSGGTTAIASLLAWARNGGRRNCEGCGKDHPFKKANGPRVAFAKCFKKNLKKDFCPVCAQAIPFSEFHKYFEQCKQSYLRSHTLEKDGDRGIVGQGDGFHQTEKTFICAMAECHSECKAPTRSAEANRLFRHEQNAPTIP
ncbi:unnamed protein product [Sympodiomycopsis kandeliae]